MEKINLWESNMNKYFIYFQDLQSLFKYLDENDLDLSFITKDSYNPNEQAENMIDNIALKNNVELIYTDKEHPIAWSKGGFYRSMINEAFFKEHEQVFKEYAQNKIKEDIQNKNCYYIRLQDFAFSNEILDLIINSENKNNLSLLYIECDKGHNLTEEQIKIIKENHLEFSVKQRYQENKLISTKYLLDKYTISDLQNNPNLRIKLPLPEEEINNFKYLQDKAIITFRTTTNKRNEETFFSQIKDIIDKLATFNKTFYIKFDVKNRELLRKSNLLNNIPSNINIQINNDLYEYDLETFKKDDDKLEALAKPIRESNLSPLEKYIAVYDIVKNFKPYKENEEDSDKSRYLRYILDDNNEYIVCVGYAKLLRELLNRVNIPVKTINVSVDMKRDKDFDEKKDNPLGGHARNMVKIDDDKYNIHGYYIADSTWDNDTELDFYLNSLMTFDRKKEAKRLETLKMQDLLFDFHNFDDFQEKINFYLKRNINKNTNKKNDKKIIDAYFSLYHDILDFLEEIDYQKYIEFYDKYNEAFKNINKLKEFEPIASNMLTEYAEYIIPLSNNKISIDTILKAATNVKKELYHFNNKEIKEWLEKATKDNSKYEKKVFPYKYDPNNKTEAYLEDYIEEEENKHTR